MLACITSYLQLGVDTDFLDGVLRADRGTAAGVLTAGVLTAGDEVLTAGAGVVTAGTAGDAENTSSVLISSVLSPASGAGEFCSAIESRLDCLGKS